MVKKILGINKNIFLLGFVSFLTDLSSEIIFSVFSIFVTVILGASTLILGLMEGLSEFAASSLDYVSGFISDKSGKRKPYTIFGYGLSTFAKGLLLFSSSIISAFSFRVTERFGKSFRGPPRDAWIASLSSNKTRGFAFGIHKALDKSGAIFGPLMAYFILKHFGESSSTFKLLFSIALLPAACAIIVLFFLKDNPEKPAKKEKLFSTYKSLGDGFKHYLKSSGIFSLAYFSFGFLLLKAYLVGFKIKDVVLLYALFNLSFVIFSPLIGKLGDKIGKKKIIISEYVIYLLMSVGFAFATAQGQIIVLFVLFGIFFAIDEGQSKAYITDLEKERRGTAIGLYNFFTGLIYLPASIIAGFLWKLNPNYAFGFAGLVSVVALIYFVFRKNTFRHPGISK